MIKSELYANDKSAPSNYLIRTPLIQERHVTRSSDPNDNAGKSTAVIEHRHGTLREPSATADILVAIIGLAYVCCDCLHRHH